MYEVTKDNVWGNKRQCMRRSVDLWRRGKFLQFKDIKVIVGSYYLIHILLVVCVRTVKQDCYSLQNVSTRWNRKTERKRSCCTKWIKTRADHECPCYLSWITDSFKLIAWSSICDCREIYYELQGVDNTDRPAVQT